MAIRGAKPSPTKLKIARGNPGKRDLNENEPEPEGGAPDAPCDLPASVKAVWDRAVVLLDGMGVLTKADGYALLILCRAAADYVIYSEKCQPGNDVLLSADGQAYWNMNAAARDKAEARLLKMLPEFGLSPSSRSRLHAEKRPGAKSKAKKRFFAAG